MYGWCPILLNCSSDTGKVSDNHLFYNNPVRSRVNDLRKTMRPGHFPLSVMDLKRSSGDQTVCVRTTWQIQIHVDHLTWTFGILDGQTDPQILFSVWIWMITVKEISVKQRLWLDQQLYREKVEAGPDLQQQSVIGSWVLFRCPPVMWFAEKGLHKRRRYQGRSCKNTQTVPQWVTEDVNVYRSKDDDRHLLWRTSETLMSAGTPDWWQDSHILFHLVAKETYLMFI